MEAKLAGPFSPLVLVVGAAVITGTAVVGIVAGPGLVACSQTDDFSQCINETFFGAQPAVAVADQEAVEPAVTEASEDAAEDEIAEAVDDVAEQEVVEAVALVAPQFDVVRVEPDGSAVIAGVATPSGAVQIFANEDEIGSEETSSAGEWAFVTDTPLPGGGVELRVYDTLSEQYSGTSVVVIVHEDRQSEPLVVASEPGAASEILQGLSAGIVDSASVAEAETAVEEDPVAEIAELEAAAEQPALEVAQVPSEAAQDEPVAPADTEAEVPVVEALAEAVSETPDVPVAAAQDEPVTETPDATEPELPAATADEDIVVAETSTPAQPEIEASTTPEPAEAELAVAPVEPDAAAEPVVEQNDVAAAIVEHDAGAAAEPAAPADESQVAEVVITPPSIDAVEIDGDRNFFAGSGTEGYAVRLYVDNRVVATTTVTDGRWLVEAINVLTERNQRVRVDMLDDDGVVAGRAEVNFVLDLPVMADETDAPIVVAEDSQAPSTPEPVTEPEPAVEAEPTPAAEPVSDEASEPEAAAQADPVQVQESMTETPVVEEPVEVVADEQIEAATETPAVEEPAAIVEPQEAEVPTMVGVTDGERTMSGRVIIRRGDNLWTIARRVYGEGIRYTQIYDANVAQIRDPNLIYPGQVFDLPETDMVIGEDGE
ncbi:LysM peptidoglycan-binding domain-containing protein [Pelagibacterium lentulum]|uniref:LysM domain-containing protein n=1 Tax=Pelagibacterium lentulum TaxID=2029865 RepID=A0A916RDS3_9HYPH|nr:LysM peptidoglycan-binding domain-containing protein [Pelagibacterium lentulum]GGA49191.1 hypothetical protein GCM10011499_18810 [Pelagibacterium lentulum]